MSRAFYFAQAIPGFLARAFYFAQGTYLAQMRTHDGGVRGIASAIPGRHPRGAHVDIVRLAIFLLGDMTPASFAWPDGFRPGRQAHRVRRKLPWAARRAVFFFAAAAAARMRARAPPFLLSLNCVRSFPTLARAAPFFYGGQCVCDVLLSRCLGVMMSRCTAGPAARAPSFFNIRVLRSSPPGARSADFFPKRGPL